MGVLALLLVCCVAVGGSMAQYRVGAGIGDITGPAVEVHFLGYANLEQTGAGIHLRCFSRAFIIDDGTKRLVFVSIDSDMMATALKREVIRLLQLSYGSLYGDSNLILSATHTHSAPGGFTMDFLGDISILGFVKQTFNAYAAGIVKSIKQAHDSMQPGKLYYKEGRIPDAHVNRSPTSYLLNPQSERDKYEDGDVDNKLVQLKMVSNSGSLVGVINWYSVHGTSMNQTNVLVSSDNTGYASVLMDEAINPPGTLHGKGKIVSAFASTYLGDVSPNTKGAKCEYSGLPCDPATSKCANSTERCIASGPGKDMFESTKIIAQKIKTEALRILQSANEYEITGPIKIAHQFVDMVNSQVPFYNAEIEDFVQSNQVRGCVQAMGFSFAGATTDGPGPIPSFTQGMTSGNPLWEAVRNVLTPPTPEDVECHKPKPILLATGRMTVPYQWQPKIVPDQLVQIGDLVLAAVPGEFTTMSGRRLRSVLTKTFADAGKTVKVVVAGLSNAYSSYVTTFEEYQAQRYEAASTLYGPHTLGIHLYTFQQLAKALLQNITVSPGPTPEDFSSKQITFVPPVIFDIAPIFTDFGDCVQQPSASYKIGSTVEAKFISGNPRNNLMTSNTFLTVEKWNEGNNSWKVFLTDANWETKFIWKRISTALGTSEVKVLWEISDSTVPGKYRIQHFGYYRNILSQTIAYSGATNTFQVTA